MGAALETLFESMHDRAIDAVHVGGPWALPMLGLAAVMLLIAKRDRVVSPAGLIAILMIAALAVTIRAIQLGRFWARTYLTASESSLIEEPDEDQDCQRFFGWVPGIDIASSSQPCNACDGQYT